MHQINPNVTELLLSEREWKKWTFPRMQVVFAQRAEIKKEIQRIILTNNDTHTEKREEKTMMKAIEDLTAQMSAMTAHIAKIDQKTAIPKCDNCGRLGHRTQYCRSRGNISSDYATAQAKIASQSLLAVEEPQKDRVAFSVSALKRMRIEDILNQDYQPRTKERRRDFGDPKEIETKTDNQLDPPPRRKNPTAPITRHNRRILKIENEYCPDRNARVAKPSQNQRPEETRLYSRRIRVG
ncbi:hypothetical protein AYI68_g6473 [Smittium mucronatum]|uniref:CCHC-type domain-containing protein n=1 Tax=Smittium mucronatum TaxID=133383 RepID=A0A1R0GRF3_9FUNG|nr:hypothetical protein AYI68_g6473 [Smittium mucronatum]